MHNDKIILYQPPGHPFGLPNMSPFCTKLETYLRMAGLPYEARNADLRKAPKGKIPYVDLGGKIMGDSQLIIEHLEQTRDKPLDQGLSPAQRARGHVVRRMLEEGTYFIGVYLRWSRDDGFALIRPEIKRVLPGPLALLLPLIRRKVRASLQAQGVGRHTDAEIQALGQADLSALSALLGDSLYFLGDEPHIVDAAAYAFVEGISRFPLDSQVQRHLKTLTNLMAFRDRVRGRYWAELS